MVKRKTHDEYIKEIKEIHKNKPFDFSKIVYKNNKCYVNIYCIKHKIYFIKRADGLLNKKSNCPECNREIKIKLFRKTNEEINSIISKYKKYDFSKVKYNGANNPIIII